MIRTILRLESLLIFLLSIAAYILLDGNWLLFALFILLPDISMIGYLKNPRLGAITYNFVHNFVLPTLLAALGYFLSINHLLLAGIVLAAHVGLDRTLGYGLKEKTSFKQTHLGKIGK